MSIHNDAFYHSRWWYSGCKMTVGWASSSAKRKYPQVPVLEPTEPFQEYDPFQSYYPPGGTSKGMRSLPYLFAEIDPENHDEIRGFCTRFGLPGPFRDKESWDDWGYCDFTSPAMRARLEKEGTQNVYAMQEEMKQIAKPLDHSLIDRMPLTRLAEEIYRFKNFLILAENHKDPQRIKNWIMNKDHPLLLRGWFRPIPADRSQATALLDEMLARGCQQLRLRFAFDSDLRMKWESLSLTSLMYLMVALDLQGPGQILTCPACHRIFVAHRAGKTYCSPECQNRFHSLQHYRNKNRSKSDKQRKLQQKTNKKGK